MYRKKPTLEAKTKYINYRNKLNTLLRKAEKFYYSERFKLISGDITKTWKLLNTITTKKVRKDGFQSFIKEDGSNILNQSDIVNKFNDFFVITGSRLAAEIPTV